MNFRSGRGRGRGLSAMNLVKKTNQDENEDYGHEIGLTDNPLKNISSDVFDDNIVRLNPDNVQLLKDNALLHNRINKLERLIGDLIVKIDKLDNDLESGKLKPEKHFDKKEKLEDKLDDLQAEKDAKNLMLKFFVTRHDPLKINTSLIFGNEEKNVKQVFSSSVCTEERYKREKRDLLVDLLISKNKVVEYPQHESINLVVDKINFQPIIQYQNSAGVEKLRLEYTKMVLEADNNPRFSAELDKIQNFSKIRNAWKQAFFEFKDYRFYSSFKIDQLVINTVIERRKKLFLLFSFDLDTVFKRLVKNKVFFNVYNLFNEDDYYDLSKEQFSKVKIKIDQHFLKSQDQVIYLINDLRFVDDKLSISWYDNVMYLQNYYFEDENGFRHHDCKNYKIVQKNRMFHSYCRHKCDVFNLDYCMLGFLKLYFSDSEYNINDLFNYSTSIGEKYIDFSYINDFLVPYKSVN